MGRSKGPTPSEELALAQLEMMTDVRDLLRAVLTCTTCMTCHGTGALKEAAAKMAHASPMHQATAVLMDAMRPCACRIQARTLLEEIAKAEAEGDDDDED
jgi:hypothetical protein